MSLPNDKPYDPEDMYAAPEDWGPEEWDDESETEEETHS